MTEKRWDAGSRMAVSRRDRHPSFPAGVVDAQMPEEAARKIALSIAKLKQTTLIIPVEVEEFLQALNYVLVGDPASVAAHRKMEAGKGMAASDEHFNVCPRCSSPNPRRSQDETSPCPHSFHNGPGGQY